MPFLPRGPSGPTQRHSTGGGGYDADGGGRLPEEPFATRSSGSAKSPVRADNVRGKQFPSTDDGPGYDKTQVDAFLDAAGIRLAAMESRTGQTGPLVSDAILAEWAEWADSTTIFNHRPSVGGLRHSGGGRLAGRSFATRFLGSGNHP